MLIRLLPPSPTRHPTILYGLTFPSFLPLHDLGPSVTIPAAWSSQLQILTSVLHLEPPSNIHMLDRAVGLVSRVRQVSMDVPQREIEVVFVDGRTVIIPMNPDCVRMLSGVVVDVKGFSEPESPRDSMEGSACLGSMESFPSGSGPTKPPKLGKHKRQRSLLFSLISSLVPKSLSLSSPPPPSSAPPPAPLPPLPITGCVPSPIASRQSSSISMQPDPEFFRRRVRATLVDVWRRHVMSALTPQHLPAAGYAEWVLIAIASEIRQEIESIETAKSCGFGVGGARMGESKHRRTRSEGRNALDFGDRMDDYESEQWRCRAPSSFPGMLNVEDTDAVVYPRQEQADEWGVRYVHHPRSFSEADVFALEYSGYNDNIFSDHSTVGNDWDDNELLTLELSRAGCYGTPDTCNHLSGFKDRDLHPGDIRLDCGENYGPVDTTFDVSRCPLTPSDINDDGESDDSQTSIRTPEDGEGLPPVPPAQRQQNSIQHAASSAPQPPLVFRVSPSRPRSRNALPHYSSAPSTSVQVSYPSFSALPSSGTHNFEYRDAQVNDFVASRFAYLERIYAALELVRSRAHEEGWKLVRATFIGAENGWSDAETERSLEIKAKRRAWSSGIKIFAPYSTSRSASKVWGSSLSTFGSPTRPHGLSSRSARILQACGPIVPTGLPLGKPVRSSPLAMYAWSADDGRESIPSKYGILKSVHNMETLEGKRTSRVTFSDNVAKLFPVCEDESEDSFEPVQVNAVGFPQAVSLCVSAEEPEHGPIEELSKNEDNLFYLSPSRPRTRTTSMCVFPTTSPAPSSSVLPMFRCSTPPPCYQATVGGDVSTAGNDEEGRLDGSALLLQPLSSLSVSLSTQLPLSRPPLSSNPPLVPRLRAVSLPTPRSYSSMNKARRTSFNHKDEHCEDLSRVYASPPPEGPLVVTATPAPHEQYPRYAHIHSPIPASKQCINAGILGRTTKEVVFEQAGSEFTVGIEVALGRAEEGRVVW